MEQLKEKIMQIALRLLVEKRVDVVLGFQKGSIPMMSQPILISEPEHVNRIHWDSFCGSNLATYLLQRRDRVAVVAKGCDSRNIVVQILENQIKREQLYIIGVPCQGMVDRRRVLTNLNGREPRQVKETSEHLIIGGEEFEETLERNHFLQENCAICVHHNPTFHDELVECWIMVHANSTIIQHSTMNSWQSQSLKRVK